MLSFSAKTGRSIDFKVALQYRTVPIPLSISNEDRHRRETAKANLQKIIIDCIANPGSPAKVETEKKVFVIDMIAHVRTMTEIPDTNVH